MMMMDASVLSYQEFFADPANNPFGSDEVDIKRGYQNVLTSWRSTNNPPSAAVLRRTTTLDFAQPVGAIGMFVDDGRTPGGVLRLMHGIMEYPGQPGRPSIDRSRLFGFVDDVTGMDIQSLRVTTEMFEVSTAVNVPTTHMELLRLLNESPDDPMVGPFDNTETSRSLPDNAR
jgi:hypothetical protein